MEESGSQGMLLIEDSTEDDAVVRCILLQATDHIMRYIDGESALDDLLQRDTHVEAQDAACPALILLDLNLPATNGRAVLWQINQHARLQTIPVVVFTTSAQPYNRDLCYQLGVHSSIVKPIDFKHLRHALKLRRGTGSTPSHCPKGDHRGVADAIGRPAY